MIRVGLISDTHNLLRPEAVAALRGSDHIIHAGDVCSQEVLDALAKLAPLTAVRGNNDKGAWAKRLKEVERLEIGGVRICVIHDVKALGPRLRGDDGVVVSGHSHRPRVDEKDGVLYVNPGSAGPRRFKLPVSAGELVIADGKVHARLLDLQNV